MSTQTNAKTLFFLMLALFMAPIAEYAQGQVEVYDPGENRPSTVYKDGNVWSNAGKEFSKELGIDGDGTTAEGEQPRLFWVRTGQRVYCAHCGLLIDDTVQTNQVSEAAAQQCYDDGTHGDDFPFDGVPSNVQEEREKFACPYCWTNKTKYEAYVAKFSEWGPRKVYDIYAGTYNEKKDRSYIIPIPDVTPIPAAEMAVVEKPLQVTSLLEMNSILRDFVDEFEATVIAQYAGLEYHTDNIRFPQAIYKDATLNFLRPGVPGGTPINFNYPGGPGGVPAGYPAAGPYSTTIGRANNVANQPQPAPIR